MQAILLIFISIILFSNLHNSSSAVYETEGCEATEHPNQYSDCDLRTVDEEYICCYTELNFLGINQKNCYEYLFEDIFVKHIEEVIHLIEIGRYWDGEVQMYEVISLDCGSGFVRSVYLVMVTLLLLVVE